MKRPNPEDYVRIELVERPRPRIDDEDALPGIYKVQTQTENYTVSFRDLVKELTDIVSKPMVEAILLRIENFRIVFVNKRTEEVFT